MLLEGKKLLVTGVLMDSSIAFHVAKLAQEQGAEVVLTSFGRTMKITQTIAKRLPDDAARGRARRHQPGAPRHPRRAAAASTSTASTACCTRSASPRRAPSTSSRAPGRTSSTAMQVSAYSLKAARRGGPAADVRGRQRRRAHLRRQVRLAGLRLDGRGQGGVRVDEPLPRPRPRPEGRSAATSSRPARSAPPRPSRSPASSSSRRSGTTAPRSAGTSTTRCPPPRPARPCCPTGSPPRPARSSTSTAACTRWGSSSAVSFWRPRKGTAHGFSSRGPRGRKQRREEAGSSTSSPGPGCSAP